MNHVRLSIRVSCFLLFALCLSTGVFALNNASAVTGIVVDPSGAVVRGATVDVIAQDKKLSTVSTDQQGHYSVSVPSAGSYEIRVSAPGFKTAIADNLAVRDSEGSIRSFTLRLDVLSEEVTVTATGTPTLESHLGAAVSVLGTNQLAGTDEIQEPLRWIPGVQMTQTGQIGGTTALYIRGGNSDANKVLIDGIPINDIGGAVEFADLSSSALARVEVLRGPNSSVYGPDAMAGVVSLTTRSGSTPLPEVTYI
jgi:vitamin B12 transporter